VTRKVFVTRRVFNEAISRLEEHVQTEMNPVDDVLSSEELAERIQGVDGVLSMVTDRIDRALMEGNPGLKVIANLAVGYNNVEVPAATEQGILVTNTPGVLTETTADFAWTLLMAASRRICEADRFVREGRFTAWGPRMLLGHDIHGKVLGLIGFGRIGQAVARRASGFDMKVLFYSPGGIATEIVAATGARGAPLEEIWATSDFVSLHVPLLPETRHLVNDTTLGKMKPNSILINSSRGPVVDEAALVRAIESNQIAGAALDVYERETEIEEGLLRADNVVLAPHIASASHETRLEMCMIAANNLVAGLRGERPTNLANTDAWERRRR